VNFNVGVYTSRIALHCNNAQCIERPLRKGAEPSWYLLYVVVVIIVVTFFNHNFVNCKATLIFAIKIYEIKYNISLNDVHTEQ